LPLEATARGRGANSLQASRTGSPRLVHRARSNANACGYVWEPTDDNALHSGARRHEMLAHQEGVLLSCLGCCGIYVARQQRGARRRSPHRARRHTAEGCASRGKVLRRLAPPRNAVRCIGFIRYGHEEVIRCCWVRIRPGRRIQEVLDTRSGPSAANQVVILSFGRKQALGASLTAANKLVPCN